MFGIVAQKRVYLFAAGSVLLTGGCAPSTVPPGEWVVASREGVHLYSHPDEAACGAMAPRMRLLVDAMADEMGLEPLDDVEYYLMSADEADELCSGSDGRESVGGCLWRDGTVYGDEEALTHELAHALLQREQPQGLGFIDEGIAGYFSTAPLFAIDELPDTVTLRDSHRHQSEALVLVTYLAKRVGIARVVDFFVAAADSLDDEAFVALYDEYFGSHPDDDWRDIFTEGLTREPWGLCLGFDESTQAEGRLEREASCERDYRQLPDPATREVLTLDENFNLACLTGFVESIDCRTARKKTWSEGVGETWLIGELPERSRWETHSGPATLEFRTVQLRPSCEPGVVSVPIELPLDLMALEFLGTQVGALPVISTTDRWVSTDIGLPLGFCDEACVCVHLGDIYAPSQDAPVLLPAGSVRWFVYPYEPYVEGTVSATISLE